jgi:hypothetical protein
MQERHGRCLGVILGPWYAGRYAEQLRAASAGGVVIVFNKQQLFLLGECLCCQLACSTSRSCKLRVGCRLYARHPCVLTLDATLTILLPCNLTAEDLKELMKRVRTVINQQFDSNTNIMDKSKQKAK